MKSFRWWLLYGLPWLPYFILQGIGIWSADRVSPQVAAAGAVITILPGFLLGAVVWSFWKRWDYGKSQARLIFTHVAIAFLYPAFWCLAVFLYIAAFRGPSESWTIVSRFIFWQYVMGFLSYGILIGVFYSVRGVRRVHEEKQRSVMAETLRTKAELEALRGRLQPHFLFNTLHSITALVRSEPLKAEQALLQLGDLLRAVLDSKKAAEDVPLWEEWQLIQNYLALEKIRLGDRLRVVADLSDDALEQAVPFFTLQPLVENAIHHGIFPRAVGGTVRISALVKSGSLILSVGDDGPGVDSATLKDNPGLGIQTVRQRLAVQFGERGKLDIVTAMGEGFCATVIIPAEIKPVNAQSPQRDGDAEVNSSIV